MEGISGRARRLGNRARRDGGDACPRQAGKDGLHCDDVHGHRPKLTVIAPKDGAVVTGNSVGTKIAISNFKLNAGPLPPRGRSLSANQLHFGQPPAEPGRRRANSPIERCSPSVPCTTFRRFRRRTACRRSTFRVARAGARRAPGARAPRHDGRRRPGSDLPTNSRRSKTTHDRGRRSAFPPSSADRAATTLTAGRKHDRKASRTPRESDARKRRKQCASADSNGGSRRS